MELKEKYYNKGTKALVDHDFKTALYYFEKSLEIDNHFINALLGKASALTWLKKFPDAVKCYDLALKLRPNDIVIENMRKLTKEKIKDM